MEDFLLQVHKPGQYIGKEWNVSRKDFESARVKFALCFPELYEVGMSNLGLRIIYGLLNTITDVVCERFFCCEADMEKILRSQHSALASLESKKSLREFDIIGFSLPYELTYTNILNMLDLSGIPLKAKERDHTFPLVIAGGPCTLNPEPLHEFFDLFVIGEAEEALIELIDAYRNLSDKHLISPDGKRELLKAFAQIEGVYVPSLYNVEYNASGGIARFHPAIEGVPEKIKKRVVNDLDNAFFPVQWLLPYVQIIHDRLTLEIMRGCPNRCRFCQARAQYYPFRQRKKETVIELARTAYRHTGYEEIAFAGLSVSEHRDLEAILQVLIPEFKADAVAFSLPSIKPKLVVESLSSLIATIKKTGLTFAPEAATERLRNILGKDFDPDDFFSVLRKAFAAGYQRVKLYFMTGIPSETPEDLDAIADLSFRVSRLPKEIGRGQAFVNLSINTLIPKPHTCFQWQRMESIEEIQKKQGAIRAKIRNPKIKVDFHNPHRSFLEGAICRGDRRLSEVIYRAFINGARFDGWEEHFSFDIWKKAFEESRLDPQIYLREKQREEMLPWDFIDTGISKEYLRQEAEKINERGLTPDASATGPIHP